MYFLGVTLLPGCCEQCYEQEVGGVIGTVTSERSKDSAAVFVKIQFAWDLYIMTTGT